MWKRVPLETFVALYDYIEVPEELLEDLLDNKYVPDDNEDTIAKTERAFDKNNNYKLEKLFRYKQHDLTFER